MIPMRAHLTWLVAGAVVSCVSTTLDVRKSHPANPSVPAAPPPKAAAPLASGFDPFEAYADDAAAPAPAGDHDHHGGHGAQSAPPRGASSAEVDHSEHSVPTAPKPRATTGPVYTCPMHPEVVRDAPGSCPTCGMKLVPKKPEADHSAH